MIYCELSEAEKDFYEALFKKSKVNLYQYDSIFLIFICIYFLILIIFFLGNLNDSACPNKDICYHVFFSPLLVQGSLFYSSWLIYVCEPFR